MCNDCCATILYILVGLLALFLLFLPLVPSGPFEDFTSLDDHIKGRIGIYSDMGSAAKNSRLFEAVQHCGGGLYKVPPGTHLTIDNDNATREIIAYPIPITMSIDNVSALKCVTEAANVVIKKDHDFWRFVVVITVCTLSVMCIVFLLIRYGACGWRCLTRNAKAWYSTFDNLMKRRTPRRDQYAELRELP